MRIDGDRKTDRKKLIVALYNFPNAPTMCRQLRTLPRTGVTGSGESRKHLSAGVPGSGVLHQKNSSEDYNFLIP